MGSIHSEVDEGGRDRCIQVIRSQGQVRQRRQIEVVLQPSVLHVPQGDCDSSISTRYLASMSWGGRGISGAPMQKEGLGMEEARDFTVLLCLAILRMDDQFF